VESDEISLARGDVSVWSRMPRVLLGGIEGRALRVEQGARSGLLAICGNWPGGESDEELMAALAEVS
jgi:hypothetical protein